MAHVIAIPAQGIAMARDLMIIILSLFSSDPTVGVDFFARLVQLTDGTKIKLQLWDTAGQERFRSITRSYYRNSVGVLLAYDICSRESFEHIPQWMSEASQHIEPHSPVFVLIGCKKDKELNRVVSQEEAQAFADFYGMNFVETSAKHGENVECAFKLLTEEIYSRVQSGEYVVQEGWDGIKAGYTFALIEQAYEDVTISEAEAYRGHEDFNNRGETVENEDLYGHASEEFSRRKSIKNFCTPDFGLVCD
ncbi:hypothetical protein QYM36_010740 [Artemia franciscana]|uniref:Ras-related protein Rab-39B n=1 Tax=Artemia franciscana TaxID=6661 RepID=A0AA88I6M3_ARTSF|nr:hypothetical protein QYM36_010740 [Artemia franciscana]